MKNIRRMSVLLLALLMVLSLGGCKKREAQEQLAQPTVRVALSAWGYEQGYTPAEGWIYETILSNPAQLEMLNGLMAPVSFAVTGQDFELGQGYRLTWLDAAGNITREELILSAQEATREGMMFEVSGAEALYQWLEALKLSEEITE